ncbi:hypothetical protein SDC9_104545 [bioreactor metagenome]|uniref:Uncharacterized protein n=1 Tax=bioreactor metagenome TaxID=1076179 RepID=A0A645AWV5_9ZZZZ
MKSPFAVYFNGRLYNLYEIYESREELFKTGLPGDSVAEMLYNMCLYNKHYFGEFRFFKGNLEPMMETLYEKCKGEFDKLVEERGK